MCPTEILVLINRQDPQDNSFSRQQLVMGCSILKPYIPLYYITYFKKFKPLLSLKYFRFSTVYNKMLSSTMLASLFTHKADYLYDKNSRHSIAVINFRYYRTCLDSEYHMP